jgi:ATP-dependent exoDNAse (exonuclease V) beta subunit
MSRSSVHAGPVAAAIGTFVHAGLECAVKKVPFNAEGRWIQICDANLLLNTRPDVALAFTEARRQLHQVLGSTAWQQLLASLPRHRTEVPITLLDQQQRLHAGTIDLLLDDGGPGRAPGHLMVVDFKTSAVDLPDLAVTGVTAEERAERIQETRSILYQHAVEHGYFEQISAYLESLAVVYPDAKKSGCIFYTRFCEMISL